MIKLLTTEQDDPQFIELISRILNGAIVCYQPKEIYVIQLDGWFDHKWQYFSGVVYCQLGTWRSPLNVPPFHPNRVLNQRYFRAKESTQLGYSASESVPLHFKQHSWDNVKREIARISAPGLFLWYSGATNENGRASTLLYNTAPEGELACYASFEKKSGWQLNKVKGISRQELFALINVSHNDIVVVEKWKTRRRVSNSG